MTNNNPQRPCHLCLGYMLDHLRVYKRCATCGYTLRREDAMITMDELLKGADLNDQDQSIQDNLATLLDRINQVRTLWGKPMTVTSGLRTKADQIRVYREKAEQAGKPFDESKVPMGSAHIKGAAVDIYDPTGELNQWCKDNEEVLRGIGLWLEHREGNWQHFQVLTFGSYTSTGTIFFYP